MSAEATADEAAAHPADQSPRQTTERIQQQTTQQTTEHIPQQAPRHATGQPGEQARERSAEPAPGPAAEPAAQRPPAGATAEPAASTPELLVVEDLHVAYRQHAAPVLAGLHLRMRPGEILGVIGETGSGKTTLARTVVGLVRAGRGRVAVCGEEIGRLRGRRLRAFRRSGRVQYVFQDPLRALDPTLTVARLVAEPLEIAGEPGRAERAARVAAALRQVGLDPAAVSARLPGALSGGQRQRVLLARALVTRPRLLISDEPVSALDASNRNLVLGLFDRLRRELGLGVLLISHDLASLAAVADRVAVLHHGRLVEQGPAEAVLENPGHPYTALLAASAPRVAGARRVQPADLLAPAPRTDWPRGQGCGFAPRCRFATAECRATPAPAPLAGGPPHHTAACHHAAGWRALLPVTTPSQEA